jgi:hypothetical protein
VAWQDGDEQFTYQSSVVVEKMQALPQWAIPPQPPILLAIPGQNKMTRLVVVMPTRMKTALGSPQMDE